MLWTSSSVCREATSESCDHTDVTRETGAAAAARNSTAGLMDSASQGSDDTSRPCVTARQDGGTCDATSSCPAYMFKGAGGLEPHKAVSHEEDVVQNSM